MSLFEFAFEIAIFAGIARLLVVTIAALVHARREAKRKTLAWMPRSLAVLIPAYNEERVVCKSVRAMLGSNLSDFPIIVIDDGSSDGTADAVAREFEGNPRVRVLRKPNGGKASALNFGLLQTDADIVVALDADTIFEPDAIALLLRHFHDDTVGAVAGAAIVGNRLNLLTRFQALEYVTSQNLDRRALELVNGITVVPGAIGAWRREALLATGGYTTDTLAEDADATIRLERAGYKVVYEPKARAITEAPETVAGFLKQRFRWMFGTLQVAYKHRDAFRTREGRNVALFGLTNILVFQFLFTLIAPMVDIMMIVTIVDGIWIASVYPNDGVPSALIVVGQYWLLFQSVDLATSAIAVALERQPGLWRLLPLLILQRFCYRQLLYFTALRTTGAILTGHLVGWNKLKRTGSVLLSTLKPREPAPTSVGLT
jgi:cellulose synthase/poly-beta-1,6-N-acetylglucosamine synthase-like glycosyltransferase